MNQLLLFLKGICVGVGKIIPGVSGSLIAVLLNIYEEAIYAINHLRDDFQKQISFLIPIGCGVVVAAIFFSNILLFFLNHFYLYTMFFFVGLILGTVPSFRKEFSFSSKRDFLVFLLFFFLPFVIPSCRFLHTFVPSHSGISYLIIFGLGFLDAATMVIPGISGTAIYLMIGCYSFVLALFSNPLEEISWTILFGMGLILGVFLVSRLVEFCFKRNRNRFFLAIYGLLWSSICYLFLSVIFQVTLQNFALVVGILFVGFLLSRSCSKI